jgi:hypothetical protein
MTRAVLAVLLALISAAPCAAELAGTEVTIPLSVRGMLGERTVNLVATEYRPAGAGPFPAIVLSHGSPNSAADRVGYTAKFPVASEVFVQWGFVVLNPVRRGMERPASIATASSSSASRPAGGDRWRPPAKPICRSGA